VGSHVVGTFEGQRQKAAKCRQGLDLSPGSLDPAFEALVGSCMALANASSHKSLKVELSKVQSLVKSASALEYFPNLNLATLPAPG
jgi:hypothetical protein